MLYLQKDLPHQASQGAVPVVSWQEAFETKPRSLPFFDTFQLLDKTPKDSCRSSLRSFAGSLAVRSYKHSLTRRTRIPAATKPVRSSACFTVESLLRSTAVKLPVPGNKSDTGEDRQHPPSAGPDVHPGTALAVGCP